MARSSAPALGSSGRGLLTHAAAAIGVTAACAFGCARPPTPDAQPAASRWTQVTAGQMHTCALLTDGRAYCWGANSAGQLGTGALKDTARTPVPVSGGLRFAELDAGGDHTCGITTAGRAYCWGDNRHGQLGSGEATAARQAPTAVAGGTTFVQISAGIHHTCAITASGEAYCWGDNRVAQLGAPRGEEICEIGDQPYHRHPCSRTPLRAAAGLHLVFVSAGSFHTCAVDDRGRAHCWGHAVFGQLGRPGPEVCTGYDVRWSCSSRPLEVVGGHAWAALEAKDLTTCGIAVSGEAYCWGGRTHGHVITDTRPAGPSHTPTRVGGRLRYRALAVTGSDSYACGVDAGSNLYCWGALPWHFRRGAFGDMTVVLTPDPERIPAPAPLVAITAGQYHVCALGAGGEILCFGSNHLGQLGADTAEGGAGPLLVRVPAPSPAPPNGALRPTVPIATPGR